MATYLTDLAIGTFFGVVHARVPLLPIGVLRDVNALKNDLEHAGLVGVFLVGAARVETFDEACQLLFLVHLFA